MAAPPDLQDAERAVHALFEPLRSAPTASTDGLGGGAAARSVLLRGRGNASLLPLLGRAALEAVNLLTSGTRSRRRRVRA